MFFFFSSLLSDCHAGIDSKGECVFTKKCTCRAKFTSVRNTARALRWSYTASHGSKNKIYRIPYSNQPNQKKKTVRDCLGHSEKDTDYPESLIHVFGRVRHERPYFGSAEKKNAQSLNRNSRVRHEVIWAEPQLEMDYTSKTWLHLCGVWSLNMEQQFVTILMGLSARACIYEVSLEMLSI